MSKLRMKIRDFLYSFAISIIRYLEKDSNYVKHANFEYKAVGWLSEHDEMQELMMEQVNDLLYVFAAHGHSGFSAPYAISLFKKLANFEPIAALTGEEWEWGEVFDDEHGTRQNRRCSHVFRDRDGRAYDIEGKIFVEKSGATYTNNNSSVDVKFPYYPESQFIDV